MKIRLLPYYFKLIGISIAVISFLLNDWTIYWIKTNVLNKNVSYMSSSGFSDAFLAIGPIIGLLIFVFVQGKN